MRTGKLLRRFRCAFLLMRTMPIIAQAPVEQNIQNMAQVGFFAFGGVGYAATTSAGELDFRAIMSEPPDLALAQFEKVYATEICRQKEIRSGGHSLAEAGTV